MKKKKNSLINGTVIALIIIIVLVLIIGMVMFAMMNKSLGTGTSGDNTNGTVATDEFGNEVEKNPLLGMDQETAFRKYGNFKDFETVSGMINSTMASATKEEQLNELLSYWFTLLRYQDYEDAYSFVDVDYINDCGISFRREDLTTDILNVRALAGIDDMTLMQIRILSGTIPTDLSGVTKYMAIIQSDAEVDGNVRVYFPFYVTEQGKIIPFDMEASSPAEKYGSIDASNSDKNSSTATTPGSTEVTTEASTTEDINGDAGDTGEQTTTETGI